MENICQIISDWCCQWTLCGLVCLSDIPSIFALHDSVVCVCMFIVYVYSICIIYMCVCVLFTVFKLCISALCCRLCVHVLFVCVISVLFLQWLFRF